MDGRSASQHDPLLAGILGGVSALRVVTLLWASAVVSIDARSGVLDRPGVAAGALGVMGLWTIITSVLVPAKPEALAKYSMTAIDVGLASAVVALDGVVYDGSHPQSFGSAWPLGAVIAAGVLWGWVPGLVSGMWLGSVNVVASVVLDRASGRLLSLTGGLVLMAATGALVGYVAQRLRTAESEVAEARAREAVSRRLHDGVLQTLAVIQRRSDDPDLVTMAREQEHGLRELISDRRLESVALVPALRAVLARSERDHRIRGTLVVVDAPTDLDAEVAAAVAGAVGEAVTNSAKHGGASEVTVCVDTDGAAMVCSVKDDGAGFDTSAMVEGPGWTQSIRGRMSDVGGSAEVVSRPGAGAEVTLRVP